MRLQLVTTLTVVCLINFSGADITSPKNNVETQKIRQLLSFEDADPKPKDGSRRTADVSASEEERFVAAVAVRAGGGPSTNPTPVSYPTPTPSPTESSNSSDDDDDGFWERFKDWLFGDDSD